MMFAAGAGGDRLTVRKLQRGVAVAEERVIDTVQVFHVIAKQRLHLLNPARFVCSVRLVTRLLSSDHCPNET